MALPRNSGIVKHLLARIIDEAVVRAATHHRKQSQECPAVVLDVGMQLANFQQR
jgi:hypothetical protein